MLVLTVALSQAVYIDIVLFILTTSTTTTIAVGLVPQIFRLMWNCSSFLESQMFDAGKAETKHYKERRRFSLRRILFIDFLFIVHACPT